MRSLFFLGHDDHLEAYPYYGNGPKKQSKTKRKGK
jgi:hypothetical protein